MSKHPLAGDLRSGRFGGLRTPSEHLPLRLSDIDWQAGRFTVTIPKSERHEGKATRIVPIFPELRPYLRETYDEAKAAGRDKLIECRTKSPNWGTTMQKFVRKAGLAEALPKPAGEPGDGDSQRVLRPR